MVGGRRRQKKYAIGVKIWLFWGVWYGYTAIKIWQCWATYTDGYYHIYPIAIVQTTTSEGDIQIPRNIMMESDYQLCITNTNTQLEPHHTNPLGSTSTPQNTRTIGLELHRL